MKSCICAALPQLYPHFFCCLGELAKFRPVKSPFLPLKCNLPQVEGDPHIAGFFFFNILIPSEETGTFGGRSTLSNTLKIKPNTPKICKSRPCARVLSHAQQLYVSHNNRQPH